MPNIERIPEPAPASSTLFGNGPHQTYAPSQGTVQLYKDTGCSLPLSEAGTPLVIGQCLNAPISGIKGASLSTLPTCGNYGTPLLIVSNVPDCKNSTAGTGADGGVVGKCEAFSSGNDIGSVELVCFGNGISSVRPTSAATTASQNGYYSTTASMAASPTSNANSDGEEEDDGDGDHHKCCHCCGKCSCDCCCICVIM
jgi:hypothetical protein